ncbi:MAG: histidine phosphatase family protein [Bacteroidia bacterium]|nr:histidine phosphatase family protein [Bacteroidia bacterium]
MKKITLLRHCKSDWSFDELSDHDRPLNKRGKGDLSIIGHRFNQLNFAPEVCFHSSAKRAKDTAMGVVEYMDATPTLEERSELYSFSAETFFEFIRNISDHHGDVLLVAHNPGLTDLINFLGDVRIDNLPTGGYCQYEFDVDQWSEVAEAKGEYRFIEYPKMFK